MGAARNLTEGGWAESADMAELKRAAPKCIMFICRSSRKDRPAPMAV